MKKQLGPLVGPKATAVYKELAEALNAYCNDHNISQRDLSVQLGMSVGAANNAIRNYQNMSSEFLMVVTASLPGFWDYRVRWHLAVGEDIEVAGKEADDAAVARYMEAKKQLRGALLEIQGMLTHTLNNLQG